MKYCDSCEVHINPAYERCPLCHKSMGEAEGELPYPKVVPKPLPKSRLTTRVKVLIALTILGMGVCVLINLVVWRGVFWSMLVIAPALYVWLLIAGTLLSPWRNGAKVLLQLAGVSALMIAIEQITPQKTWVQDYIIPFLIITAIIMEIYYMYDNRKRWRESMVYVIITVIIGFVPLLLLSTGVITVWWPAAGSAFMAGFTLVGLILFAIKQFKNEMTKRFHL